MFDFRYKDKASPSGIYFPGSAAGNYDKIGAKQGKGFNVNVAFNADQHDPLHDIDYWFAFTSVVLPITEEFQPDIILVSQVQITKVT